MNWSLVISGLALLVSLGTVIYVQQRLDKRELVKWQRDALTKALTPVLEELETIRQESIDSTISHEAVLGKLSALRHHSNLFLPIGFHDFSQEYIKILNTLYMQINMHRGRTGIYLSADLIPEMTYKLIALAQTQLRFNTTSTLQVAMKKIDHFFRPAPPWFNGNKP